MLFHRTQNVSDLCELPVHPEHGKYTVLKQFHAGPDDNHTFFQLFYWCEVGYGIVGDAHVNCSNGVWSDELPTCVGGCSLHYKAGISYLCKKWRSLEFSTLCDIYIPNGAEVLPVCDTPYYRSDKDLPPMKCVDGNWNYTAACLPGCGIDFSEKGVSRQGGPGEHVSGGRTARNRELPWHVGIYNKMYKPYMQICGGTIISAKVVNADMQKTIKVKSLALRRLSKLGNPSLGSPS
ncbi:Modular serine protease [Eumeta japonica]|uniref:Modular serine protease n=1 Tax=Eumeta variegata TaxID=151549 RepID=A0A4C1UW42_EUMVA|nr:Modular serine protease [Eumeta japonica]